MLPDLLAGDAAAGAARLAGRLRPASASRGFAAELRDLLMRAVERGVGRRRISRLGRREQRGLGGRRTVLHQYLDVTALARRRVRPGRLIRAAAGCWLRRPGLLAEERAAPARRRGRLPGHRGAGRLLGCSSGGGRDLVSSATPTVI